MSPRIFNALFLCTGNSARSIMAEALLNKLGAGRFQAYSAGSHPLGRVHPMTIEILKEMGHPVAGLRSKSWDEFVGPGAPEMDFVFTVCDKAAGEVCPILPGHPMTAHWGVEDPAAVTGPGEERKKAFSRAYHQLAHRIQLFVSLPLEKLDRMILRRKLQEIGKMTSGESASRP